MTRPRVLQFFPAPLLLCALLALSHPGCAGGGLLKDSYRNTAASALPVDRLGRTNDRIDRYETYATYFKIARAADRIAVSVTAEYVADIMGTKKSRNVYFIVEKVVDMTGLGNRNLTRLNAELGRNFGADWMRDREITILSSKSEPFRNLDAGSLYRVRYTAFAKENFTFTVTIKADAAVTFVEAPK